MPQEHTAGPPDRIDRFARLENIARAAGCIRVGVVHLEMLTLPTDEEGILAKAAIARL